MSEKRIIIVDFNHLVYAYQFAPYDLTTYMEINGKVQEISTKLHKGITAQLNKWSNRGKNKIIVCFDNPVPARRAYFASLKEDQGYKAGRKSLPEDTLNAITQIQGILREAGIPVLQGYNFEADDLIFAVLQKCKKEYPDMPIDIITNDADLLPLVDTQVSVFLRSNKFSRAERPDLLKKSYIQYTPKNFQQEVQERGDYKKFNMPYNSILLYKLLRGDKSDNIPGLKGYGPKKYNELIGKLEKDNVDFASTFRYGVCPIVFKHKETGEIQTSVEGLDPKEYKACYGKPKEITNIISVLEPYLDEEELNHVEAVYKGMNLNQPYVGTKDNPTTKRVSANVTVLPSEYDETRLAKALLKWNIRLK